VKSCSSMRRTLTPREYLTRSSCRWGLSSIWLSSSVAMRERSLFALKLRKCRSSRSNSYMSGFLFDTLHFVHSWHKSLWKRSLLLRIPHRNLPKVLILIENYSKSKQILSRTCSEWLKYKSWVWDRCSRILYFFEKKWEFRRILLKHNWT